MKRRQGRELAVQSLYHIEMNEVKPDEAVDVALEEALTGDVEEDGAAGAVDVETARFVRDMVGGANDKRIVLDELLAEFLKGWKMDRLSRVDRQILRLAAYEMLYRNDVPPKVVINEAIELAKHFGTEESGKFVNGVLGQMIKQLDELREKAGV